MAIRRPLTQVIDGSTGAVWTEEFSASSGDDFQVGSLTVDPSGAVHLGSITVGPEGTTLAGIDMAGHRIRGIGSPRTFGDAVGYGHDAVLQNVIVDMLSVAAWPSTPNQAATKAYVDSVAQGLKWHPPVDFLGVYGDDQLVGPTANFAGIERGKRILNVSTTSLRGGIWFVDSAGNPSRPEDFAERLELHGGDAVIVKGQGSEADQIYICASDYAVVDRDVQAWTEFRSALGVSFGRGLENTNNVVAVNAAGPELDFIGSSLHFAGLGAGFKVEGVGTKGVTASNLSALVAGGALDESLHFHNSVSTATPGQFAVGTVVRAGGSGLTAADLSTAASSRVCGVVVACTEPQSGFFVSKVVTSGVVTLSSSQQTTSVSADSAVSALPGVGGTVFLGANGTLVGALPAAPGSYLVEIGTVIAAESTNAGESRTVLVNIVRLGRRPY